MKKLLSILLAVLMLCSLAACGGKKDGGGQQTAEGNYDIVVWVSEVSGMKELTQKQIEKFNADNDDVNFNATIEGISEADAATLMLTDVESGADLYCFAQDQTARLVQAGALAVLGAGATETVRASNDVGSVGGATFGDTLYAYPMTSDNGFFMYYDKSVISEDMIGDLATLVKACEDNNKFFSMNYKSAWYNAAFFFGTGCVTEWQVDDSGAYVGLKDTYNSDAGLAAMKGLEILAKSTAHNDSGSGDDFNKNSAVVISGTWDSNTVKEALGDNMGVAELPSFEVDGVKYHMGSFSGGKLMGVKPQSDPAKASALQRLALYLTGAECQLERYNELNWGPSNLEAQNSDAVKADPILSAFNAQNAYATPQGQVNGSWWDIGAVLGTAAEEATSDDDLRAALAAYEASVKALLNVDPAIANAFTVIGSFDGHAWDFDAPMTEVDGFWVSDPINFAAGDEFKVRKGLSWDEAYPGDNFVVETAGEYMVVLDPATGDVSLQQ